MVLFILVFLIFVVGLLVRFFFLFVMLLLIKGWFGLGCEVWDWVWVCEGIVKLWNLYLFFCVFVLKLVFLVFKKVKVWDVGL